MLPTKLGEVHLLSLSLSLFLKKLHLFHSVEVLFPEYSHTTELDKTMEIGFPTFFYSISRIFPHYERGQIFPITITITI